MAKFLGRLIKADFYGAAQARQIGYADPGRLVGLVMDEYPLVATGSEGRFGDITQLQSLRSKRAFVVAATQGLISLDMVIGAKAREALLINFNNLFFFNSHEAQIDAFAQAHFGLAPRSFRASLEVEDAVVDGSIATDRRRSHFHALAEDWVCPPGRLSRLEPNQAFVSLGRGRVFLEPVWFEPEYYSLPIAHPAGGPSGPDVVEVLRRIHRDWLQEQERKRSNKAAGAESAVGPAAPGLGDQIPSREEALDSPAEPSAAASDEPSGVDIPCTVTLSGYEYGRLCGRQGLVTRCLGTCQEGRVSLRHPQAASAEEGEVELVIPANCLDWMLKQPPLNSFEKRFQNMLRGFLPKREEQG